jgi:hypothetical protein
MNVKECRIFHFWPNVPLKENLNPLLVMFPIPGTYKLYFVSSSLRTSQQSAESLVSLGTTFRCYVDRTRELKVPEILMSSVLFISLQFRQTIFRIVTTAIWEHSAVCSSNIWSGNKHLHEQIYTITDENNNLVLMAINPTSQQQSRRHFYARPIISIGEFFSSRIN